MFESIKDFFAEIWAIPEARWVIWITILVIAIAIAIYVANLFRGLAMGNDSGPSGDLSDFESMHRKGQLDEEELKSLKTTVRGKIQNDTE